MTDLSPLPNSQQVPSIETVVGTNAEPLKPPPTLTNGASVEEEEDYTIKCICGFQDDDGNTVYCETCNTWQHIECYYEPGKAPGEHDNHYCAECEPRAVDARLAKERQRAKRSAKGDAVEKKVKKPPAKSHKRKLKPLEGQPVTGSMGDRNDLASPRNGANSNMRDQPPAKRQKSGHKQSNSIATPNANAKLPSQSRRSASASQPLPSPSKAGTHTALEFTYEPYSPEFMNLYDNDPGETAMEANVHSGFPMTNDLATWSSDAELLAHATNGKGPQDVFLRIEQPIDEIQRPTIHKQCKEDPEKEYHGRHPKWFYLTVESDLVQDSFVGELRGHIGYMKDYVQNDENRWEYLRHPLPFVFFHPVLPIYIDTRSAGTLLRYVRRSCQPNLSMKTILEDVGNDGDYHFCFVANQNIEAGSELTIPWTTDEHVRAFTQKLGGGIKSENSTENDEGYVLEYFSRVFADFGGCACGAPDKCSITNLAERLRMLSTEHPPTNGKPKRGRKSGNQASTNGNSRGNTSRSGSEAVRHQDEEDLDDTHSTSTSSRSKPQSRDITPANQMSVESKGIVHGLEVSERDKRKIAAMEKAEQDKNQPAQKKKKRTSGNSASANPTTAVSKQAQGSAKPRYADAGTMRKQSGSPTSRSTFAIPPTAVKTSPTSPTPKISIVRPNYVDASMQTDPDPEEQPHLSPSVSPTSRKPYMSLKKRLLTKAHQEKVAMEEKRKCETTIAEKSPTANPLDDDRSPTATVSSSKDVDEDVVMDTGAATSTPPDTSTSPTVEKPRPPDSPDKETEIPKTPPLPLQPPPPPSNASTWPPTSSSQGFRNTELRVTLPPNPLTNGTPPTPSNINQSPIAQTPSTTLTPSLSTGLVQPSPIKKKLSLGDYISRRGSTFQKNETSATATSGASKEKEKETDSSSPTAASAVDANSTLAPVSEEHEQEKEVGSSANNEASPNKLETDAIGPVPAPDAMDIDSNG